MDLSSIEEHLCASCNRSSESKSNLSSTAFWVNTDDRCRHRFCDRCYQREFSIKRQFACPRCKHIVNKQNLSQKDPDEIEVERDFTIRKKIKGIYNKALESFETPLEFRDYEETVEDIIYNLVNNTDVEQTNREVESYQKNHRQQIAEDQSKRQSEFDLVKEDIRAAEEMKSKKSQEEKMSLLKDRMLNDERVRQMNEIQLGEREVMTVPVSSSRNSLTATSRLMAGAMGAPAPVQIPASFAPSHVLSVLASRPEPKILTLHKNSEKLTGGALHSMHLAGGYEHINYTRRNWVDIIGDITAHTRNMNMGSSSNSNSSSSASSSSSSGSIEREGEGASVTVAASISQSSLNKEETGATPFPWPLLWD